MAKKTKSPVGEDWAKCLILWCSAGWNWPPGDYKSQCVCSIGQIFRSAGHGRAFGARSSQAVCGWGAILTSGFNCRASPPIPLSPYGGIGGRPAERRKRSIVLPRPCMALSSQRIPQSPRVVRGWHRCKRACVPPLDPQGAAPPVLRKGSLPTRLVQQVDPGLDEVRPYLGCVSTRKRRNNSGK
jgi:hypothetical protein